MESCNWKPSWDSLAWKNLGATTFKSIPSLILYMLQNPTIRISLWVWFLFLFWGVPNKVQLSLLWKRSEVIIIFSNLTWHIKSGKLVTSAKPQATGNEDTHFKSVKDKLGEWCLPLCVWPLCWSQWGCVWFLPSPLSCWRSPGKLLNLSEQEFFTCKVAIITVPASLTVWVWAKSFRLCLTLYHHMDCSPPGTSMGYSRQESWCGLPCPPQGDLPDPGMEPTSLMSPALADGFCTTSATWKA